MGLINCVLLLITYRLPFTNIFISLSKWVIHTSKSIINHIIIQTHTYLFYIHSNHTLTQFIYLFQLPLPTLTANLHSPLLIQRHPARIQDRRRGNGILECRERSRVQLVQCYPAFIQRRDRVNELLETDVPVPCLAAEVAFFVGRIAHVEAVMELACWFGGKEGRTYGFT